MFTQLNESLLNFNSVCECSFCAWFPEMRLTYNHRQLTSYVLFEAQ